MVGSAGTLWSAPLLDSPLREQLGVWGFGDGTSRSHPADFPDQGLGAFWAAVSSTVGEGGSQAVANAGKDFSVKNAWDAGWQDSSAAAVPPGDNGAWEMPDIMLSSPVGVEVLAFALAAAYAVHPPEEVKPHKRRRGCRC